MPSNKRSREHSEIDDDLQPKKKACKLNPDKSKINKKKIELYNIRTLRNSKLKTAARKAAEQEEEEEEVQSLPLPPSSSSSLVSIEKKPTLRRRRKPPVRSSEMSRLTKSSSSSQHVSPPTAKESKLSVVASQLTRSNSISSEENFELRPARRLTRATSLNYRTGEGLIDLTTKEFHNNDDKACSNMFIYWDDANELVSRLRLLVSSVSAGHTGHNNEILSIIEELREANIIE